MFLVSQTLCGQPRGDDEQPVRGRLHLRLRDFRPGCARTKCFAGTLTDRCGA